MAGTSRENLETDSSSLSQLFSCFLASLMAALVAEWTVAARSNGGSPEAAKKIKRSNNVKYVEPSAVKKWFVKIHCQKW